MAGARLVPAVTQEQVDELRVEMRDRGVRVGHVTDVKLGSVVTLCGSVGLAADALGMERRPGWLREIVGS